MCGYRAQLYIQAMSWDAEAESALRQLMRLMRPSVPTHLCINNSVRGGHGVDTAHAKLKLVLASSQGGRVMPADLVR